MHWGINPPFLLPPIYWFFMPPPPSPHLILGVFHEHSFFTPSYLLKVTEFVVKISQFEFSVMTEQSILLDKLFLSLNTSDFRCFIKKLHPPLKNVTPFFPSNPPLKPEVLSSTPPPPFWKFGKSFNHPPSRRGAVCAL